MSNTDELHKILEKQRGIFCQVAMIYFTAIMIGLGLLQWQGEILGFFVLVIVDVVFLAATTAIFALLTFYLQRPGTQISEKIEDLMKYIKSQVNEDGKEEN